MSENSGIEWTDNTFNPWWGCARVSKGCEHCYAETLAKRVGQDVWGKGADRRFFGDPHWNEPVKWNRKAEAEGVRRRVFCASMADVFEDHPALPEHRTRLWDLIEATPHLDWQILTKRPENIRDMVPPRWLTDGFPRNYWQGTTVEDQDAADKRVPIPLEVPAAVLFLSCEPLLGPVDLTLADDYLTPPTGDRSDWGPAVNWVIAGGESGPGARPMDLAWARLIREHCERAGTAFLMKQLGSVLARELGVPGKGHRLEDLPEDLRVRQFPRPRAAAAE